MALTITVPGNASDVAGVPGNNKYVIKTLTFGGTYTAGGEILTGVMLGLESLHIMLIAAEASGYVAQYDYTNEKMKLYPDDLYGAVKTMAESNIQDSGLDFVILRFANVYGYNPHSKQKGGPIENFINSVFQKSSISVFGSGKQKIDYINIKDIGDCIEMSPKDCKKKKFSGILGNLWDF